MNRLASIAAKQATVAIGIYHTDRGPNDCPYDIIGTGFCIDYRGVVVTCGHVLPPLFGVPWAELAAVIRKPNRTEAEEKLFRDPWTKNGKPSAIFLTPSPGGNGLICRAAGLGEFRLLYGAVDLAAVRIYPMDIFPTGVFPSLAVVPYNELYEGMEIGTYGFPTGNRLQETINAYGSSYSGGYLSQIAPHWGANPGPNVRFMLDIRATHGNSGGPVFDSAGRVFGVLSGGVPDMREEQVVDQHPVPEGGSGPTPRGQIRDYLNFVRSEPVYHILPLVEQLAQRAPTLPAKAA